MSPDLMEKLYVQEGDSLLSIARVARVGEHTVARALRRRGVEIRGNGGSRRITLPSVEQMERDRARLGTWAHVAAEYGCSEDTIHARRREQREGGAADGQ